jgi:hypothetical protein
MNIRLEKKKTQSTLSSADFTASSRSTSLEEGEELFQIA